MTQHITRRRALALAAGASMAAAAGPALAAPSATLIDPRWRTHGEGAEIDQSAWAAFLSDHLRSAPNGVALFDYAAAQPQRAKLQEHLSRLSAAPVSRMTHAQQFAFWANLYNAITIDLVLEAYPVKSIKEVRGGWFNLGPWKEKVVTIEGQELSLDDIEHGVLRPVFNDPRVHYAVNCASIGCPNLLGVPFKAETLEAQLDAAARAYVNHPRGAHVEANKLAASSIYDWFQADFGGSEQGVIAHLKSYAAAPLAQQLKGRTSIDRFDYDWALNAA